LGQVEPPTRRGAITGVKRLDIHSVRDHLHGAAHERRYLRRGRNNGIHSGDKRMGQCAVFALFG
jgi:hypothetical protein